MLVYGTFAKEYGKFIKKEKLVRSEQFVWVDHGIIIERLYVAVLDPGPGSQNPAWVTFSDLELRVWTLQLPQLPVPCILFIRMSMHILQILIEICSGLDSMLQMIPR